MSISRFTPYDTGAESDKGEDPEAIDLSGEDPIASHLGLAPYEELANLFAITWVGRSNAGR